MTAAFEEMVGGQPPQPPHLINGIVVFVIVVVQVRRQRVVELGRASTQRGYAVSPPHLFVGAAIYRLATVRDVMVRALAALLKDQSESTQGNVNPLFE